MLNFMCSVRNLKYLRSSVLIIDSNMIVMILIVMMMGWLQISPHRGDFFNLKTNKQTITTGDRSGWSGPRIWLSHCKPDTIGDELEETISKKELNVKEYEKKLMYASTFYMFHFKRWPHKFQRKYGKCVWVSTRNVQEFKM